MNSTQSIISSAKKPTMMEGNGHTKEGEPASAATAAAVVNAEVARDGVARDSFQARLHDKLLNGSNTQSIISSAKKPSMMEGDDHTKEGEPASSATAAAAAVNAEVARDSFQARLQDKLLTGSLNTNTNIKADMASEDVSMTPGAFFVPCTVHGEIQTGYSTNDKDSNSNSCNDDNEIQEGDVILQGFLPEEDPSSRAYTPSSRAAPSSREERTRKRIQNLIDNAVTLRDSAVITIDTDFDYEEEGQNVQNHVEKRMRSNSSSEKDDKEDKSHFHHWLLPILVLAMAACISLAIVLSFHGRGGSDKVPGSRLDDTACLPGGVDVRFALAKSILSTITSHDLLVDESTPQGKAIRWIVCDDSISVQLLGNQDPSTGNLPKQLNKGLPSGLSGEAQVTRRYVLATFYYSTTQDGPWTDSLNFLSPDLHECNWHGNYTRQNFPFGEFDPVGVICSSSSQFEKEV